MYSNYGLLFNKISYKASEVYFALKVNSQKMCSVQTVLKYVGYSAGEMTENSEGGSILTQ